MSARVVAGAALLLGLALPPPAHAITFTPCPGLPGIQCGSLDVPLDHSGRVPGSLRLHVERVPARKASRAPLFVLEGGPGRECDCVSPRLRRPLAATARRS